MFGCFLKGRHILYLTTPKLEWSDCLQHPSVDAVYLSSNPAPSKNPAILTLMPQGLQELGAPKSRKFENWAYGFNPKKAQNIFAQTRVVQLSIWINENHTLCDSLLPVIFSWHGL